MLFFVIFFLGIIDIINLKKISYNKNNTVEHVALTEGNDGKNWEQALKARAVLVDKLSEHSDDLAHHIITAESLDGISPALIANAIRSATLSHVSHISSHIKNYIIL